MVINTYEDLSSMQLDVLKEVGNIGSGNAAAALSNMIHKDVLIEMPSVKLVGFQEAVDCAGGAEEVVAGILVRMSGDIEGIILLLLETQFSKIILDSFFGETDFDLLNLSEVQESALSEVGNIMASSYVGAIAQLAGINVSVVAPMMQVDMLGALMSVPVIEFGEVGDKLLFIDKKLKIDCKSIKSTMMLIPTVKSLENIMTKLGVTE